MSNKVYEFFYDKDSSERIDKYLSDLPKTKLVTSLLRKSLYSRSYIENLIQDQNITINNKKIKKSYLLKKNDLIKICIPEKNDNLLTPQKIPLDIVFEDEYIAIINKPHDMVVHPTSIKKSYTLVNALLAHFGDNLSNVNDETRPGIVHRLDKDTSGLMIIAKENRTHVLLQNIFKERKIRKYYKAITIGIPFPYEGVIHTYLNRSQIDKTKMTVDSKGKEAITLYRVTHSFDYFSLVDIKIETGRTHQIRTHLSYINHPILGDKVYSSKKQAVHSVPNQFQSSIKNLLNNVLHRQALHAYKLVFEHPIKNELLFFESKLPNDIIMSLKSLEKIFYKQKIEYTDSELKKSDF